MSTATLTRGQPSALALMRAAAERFDSAAVDVSFQRKIVRVTDDDFDLAAAPSRDMPRDLDAEAIRAVQAAKTVRSLTHEQKLEVALAARSGSKDAERVICALVLDKLCTMRRAARRVMLKALDGDADAKQLVEDTFVSALQNQDRAMKNRAYLAACMLRDALRLAMLPADEDADAEETVDEGDGSVEKAPDATAAEGAPSNDVSDPTSEPRDGPETGGVSIEEEAPESGVRTEAAS